MPVDISEFIAAFNDIKSDTSMNDDELVDLINNNIKIIKSLAHTDEMGELVSTVGLVKKAIAKVKDARSTSELVASRLELLEQEVPPVLRHIENLGGPMVVGPEAGTEVVQLAKSRLSELGNETSKETIMSLLADLKSVRGELTREEKANLNQQFQDRAKAGTLDLELSKAMFEFIFNCDVTVSTSNLDESMRDQFTAQGFVDIANCMKNIPDSHLPTKWLISPSTGTQTSGSYDQRTDVLDATVGMDDVRGRIDHERLSQEYLNATTEDHALYQTKNLDNIVKHEVGHKVDAMINSSGDKYQSTDFGGWELSGKSGKDGFQKYFCPAVSTQVDGFISQFIRAMVPIINREFTDQPPSYTYNPTVRTDLVIRYISGKYDRFYNKSNINDMVKEMILGIKSISAITTPLYAVVIGTSVDTSEPKKTKFDSKFPNYRGLKTQFDNMISEAVRTCVTTDFAKATFQATRKENWFNMPSSPIAIGGKVYMDTMSPDGWASFTASTYANHISKYQYRSPGEWFAEFYTGINHDNDKVRAKAITAYTNAAKWIKAQGCAIYPDEIS